ncbi:MAG TPA: hypothetical protein EYP09_05310, partial [Anaerolineae bacterium]|nr:hypothetical protein [Anaerolineae bacterium]
MTKPTTAMAMPHSMPPPTPDVTGGVGVGVATSGAADVAGGVGVAVGGQQLWIGEGGRIYVDGAPPDIPAIAS